MKLGLENIHALLDRLGHPDEGLTFLHVAGTNGKGSVCANLAALLRATGYRRVGLYTSPHLVSFRERILVDGEPIPTEFVLTWLQRAQPIILELNATYFECVTALAVSYFRACDCEAVVLETGLGGRLDATNAVLPALSVVTSVSLDHTGILGETVGEIFGEKIGILKPGIPIVVREKRPELLASLEAKAAPLGSPVIVLRDFQWKVSTGPESTINFQGKFSTYAFPADLRPEAHQVENLCLALLAMEVFRCGPLPSSEILIPFLREAKLPGRTQALQGEGMLPLILDGAHNPDGMIALSVYLRQQYPGRRILALFAVMRDKDFTAVFRSVLDFAFEVRFVSLEAKFPRALPYAELVRSLTTEERERVNLFALESENLVELLQVDGSSSPDSTRPDLVVVCGSLYLLGEVIPMLLPYYHGLDWFRKFAGEA